MFIALGVMSVQLLLLRKSIYWTWVYCKITKVKTWINSASVALLLLPSHARERRVPQGSTLCLIPTRALLSMRAKPPSVGETLPGVCLAGPLWGDRESYLKKQTLKKVRKWPVSSGRTFGCVYDPVVSRGLGWGCRIWPRKGAAESSLSVKTLMRTSS